MLEIKSRGGCNESSTRIHPNIYDRDSDRRIRRVHDRNRKAGLKGEW